MNRKPVSHKLQLDNAVIEYTVQRDRRRTVQISVFNGNIAVSAPICASDQEIQAIVWRRSGWILDKLANMSAGSKELPLPELATGDTLPCSGQKQPLVVNETELSAEKPMQAGRLRTAVELAIERAEQIERQQREAEGKRAWEEYEDERAKQSVAERQRLEADRTMQAAAERDTEQRRLEVDREKQAALMANSSGTASQRAIGAEMQADNGPEVKKPEVMEFGITSGEYALYKGYEMEQPSFLAILVGLVVSTSVGVWLEVGNGWLSAAAPAIIWVYVGVCVLAFLVIWSASANDASDGEQTDIIGSAIFAAVIAVFVVPIVIGLFVDWLVFQFKKRRMLKGPVVSRIKLYEEAEAAYHATQEEAERRRLEEERVRQEAQRQQQAEKGAKQAALRAEQQKREEYWESLGGIEFEQELGKLFRALGYNVKLTPASGDQGVDLILRKNGKTTVVQCKAHKRPASPAMVRELYGSMYAFGADSAILACTGGFSGGVRDFARGRPIQLISAQEIARMATDGRIGTMGSQQELIPVRGAERLAKGNRRET